MARFVAATSQIINRIFSANAAFPSATFANLPTAGVAGRVYRVTDAGTTGSIWMDTGTRWKPVNGQTVLASLDAASSNVANTEAVAFQYLIPAGLFQTHDRLRIAATLTKSGATDSGVFRVRIGTAGTTSDTQIINASVLLGAANRSAGPLVDLRLESATTIQQAPNAGSNNIGNFYGNATNTAFAAAVTITSAAANALYVSVGIASSSTTDTVALQDATLTLIASAN